MRIRCSLLTVALLVTGPALGQTPSPPAADTTVDLPITAPSFQPPQATTPLPASAPAPSPTPSPEPVPTPVPPDPVDVPGPPPILYGEPIAGETNTIVYVLDLSCSMLWDAKSYTRLDATIAYGPRIDRARTELSRSINGLSDSFSFNIIGYDCAIRKWSATLKRATEANKTAALAWLAALAPTGATATGPAAALALEEKENMSVVLLTDGAPNCGVVPPVGMTYEDAHRRVIRLANTQGATINVFGIAATGGYRAFCQAVASDNGGVFFDVP